jgi:hypothetical protein
MSIGRALENTPAGPIDGGHPSASEARPPHRSPYAKIDIVEDLEQLNIDLGSVAQSRISRWYQTERLSATTDRGYHFRSAFW